MVYLRDTLVLDKPRRTRDGYLAVRARAARVGVYDYAGFEIDPDNAHGLRDQAVVKVLRDDATVFDEAAVRSFIGKPITNDHPKEPVTAANWRDHARGTVMGALRDGDYLAFDLLLTDAETIAAVDSGKRELSNGYGVDLEIGSFKAADGTVCQARQSRITGGNHVALVDRGRAGSECAIKDGKPSFAICDAIPADVLARLTSIGDTQMKTLTIDGLIVPNVSDEAAAAIDKLTADKAAAETKMNASDAKVAELTTQIAAKDAEIVTLKKQAEDAAITPAKLRDAAKAYAAVCDKAKALGVTFAEDADAEAIQKAVVSAKLGDVAKDWTADQIAVSFATLTSAVKAADQETRIIAYPTTQDAAKGVTDARRQWLNNKATAYRPAAQA